MSQDFSNFAAKWSMAHGVTSANKVVGVWLRISYLIARASVFAWIPPNFVIFFGIVLAAATALFSPQWWIVFLLLLSLLCDGVVGGMEILQNKVSKFGSTLGSVADRISEALWAVAFYRLGASITWVVTLWLVAALQEYARARLGSEGINQMGVITPAERPVRAIILVIAVLVAQFPSPSQWVNGMVISMTVLQLISFAMVLKFARNNLK